MTRISHANANRNAQVGSAMAPKFTDRVVIIAIVACPVCGAEVGEKCVSSVTGKPLTPHAPRRRLAVRAQPEIFEPGRAEAIRFVQQMSGAERRATRLAAGVRLTVLARELGITPQELWRLETGHNSPTGTLGAAYGKWLREQLARGS